MLKTILWFSVSLSSALAWTLSSRRIPRPSHRHRGMIYTATTDTAITSTTYLSASVLEEEYEFDDSVLPVAPFPKGQWNDKHQDNDASPTLSQDYVDRFGGLGRLYANPPQLSAETVLKRLQKATVVIVGVGGVGSWTAEAICRSGVGHVVLIDLDDVCVSNTNRQVHAVTSRIGQMKIDVMRERLLDIAPQSQVTVIHDFVTPENAKSLLQQRHEEQPITALIDAIDGSTAKAALVAACVDLRVPVITCGGAAGRQNPLAIQIVDLVHVQDDRLLSQCRRLLRKEYGFPAGLSFSQQRTTNQKLKKWNIACITTTEPPLPKSSTSTTSRSTSSFRLCDSSLGTASFVTGTYGFAAASLCVEMIVHNKLKPPNRRRRG